MPKSTSFEQELLDLYFNGVAMPEIAENDATSPALTITVALHTADPGKGGNQSTNEIAYTGYARQTRTRDASGWIRDGSSISPVANIDFGEMTAGAGGVVTHVSLGSGVGNRMQYFGVLSSPITVVVGVIPRIKATSTITEE